MKWVDGVVASKVNVAPYVLVWLAAVIVRALVVTVSAAVDVADRVVVEAGADRSADAMIVYGLPATVAVAAAPALGQGDAGDGVAVDQADTVKSVDGVVCRRCTSSRRSWSGWRP